MGQRTRELDDLLLLSDSSRYWKKAQELDYDILRYFNDHPFSPKEEVIGILCIENLAKLRLLPLKNTKTFSLYRQWHLSLGHTCIITDFTLLWNKL